MSEFNFEEWSYEINGKTKLVKDSISEKDFYFNDKCGKPIIKKSGIGKLQAHNDITITNMIPYNIEVPEKGGTTKSVLITLELTMPGKSTFATGEASSLNLKDIGKAYPIATAHARALARGVIALLGIDAYGEDEADEFRETDTLTDEDKARIKNQIITNHLFGLVRDLGKEKGVDDDKVKNLIKSEAGIDPQQNTKPENIDIKVYHGILRSWVK